jgi:CRP-like cAMP-binding protein
MISFFRFLRTIHALSEPLRDRLEEVIKERHLSKKEYLLKEGQICGNVYFVEKGVLRTYYIKDGRDISSGFSMEGEICVSLESFTTQQRSGIGIRALEESVVYYITYKDLQEVYAKYPESNFMSRVLMERCRLADVRRVQAMWMQSADDRFDWLVAERPELVKRVQGKYLCTYLGITEGMLSNVKSGKAKGLGL